MEKYYVNNMSQNYCNYKYVVVRDSTREPYLDNGYWYWGSYNDLILAQEACRECGNGIVVESENIVPISFCEW